ncbi:MAG: hypothetical protein JZU58_05495 [Curvibacter lanceolatus]|jgi:hypothetical protein|uniref:hypothetical protein n=1 Tax=Curvibacter lanceolatus TaxID=86182 RepID=UPI002355537F|nr:hypothetical protein [Curvibacter lanceolatus]MBV5291788.1 hypothetical protein [Curvibacter lanceolatus]
MNSIAATLADCDDVQSLATTLAQVCAAFGPVAYLRIMTLSNRGQREALCFIQLTTRANEAGLAALLQATWVDDFLTLRVPLGGVDHALLAQSLALYPGVAMTK